MMRRLGDDRRWISSVRGGKVGARRGEVRRGEARRWVIDGLFRGRQGKCLWAVSSAQWAGMYIVAVAGMWQVTNGPALR